MREPTVREVMDALSSGVVWSAGADALQPGASEELGGGSDALLHGDASAAVRGIAVAFTATIGVLREAASSGANLLIVHEGAYYSHVNDPGELAGSAVCAEKRRRIERSGLAVYRCHDAVHRSAPDLIAEGLVRELGWQMFEVRHTPAASIVELPMPMAGERVVRHVKACLGLERVRIAGSLAARCRRVGLLVGYRGGAKLAVPLLDRCGADIVLYGEGPEWETPEYVRDAAELGGRSAVVALGHLESEQPGMKLLAERLQARFPDVPVRFCPVDPAFRSL
ncbi:Nif3-like dinuclear metal center hexameric protein [Cohnella hongkongensis]|uniref:GTP cyclohydrolase 1 type 2 homolog n=1 Tax=Cohnella hongkongensis TaxID=178337 RepID=A0ABV9F700_9BACL